jgi:hypothetical protein
MTRADRLIHAILRLSFSAIGGLHSEIRSQPGQLHQLPL